MSDKELIKAYVVSVYILALLDEYGKLERLGAFAKVYNTIVRKNAVFQKQIQELSMRKKKKISHKAKLFSLASKLAQSSWDKTTKETKGISISVGSTVTNLFRLNEDVLSRIYGFKAEDFRRISKLSQAGVTLSSCKMARVLTENTDLLITDKEAC